jgi:anthranilate synthase component 1
VLDACIAIRTIVLHDGVALLQAGAGIVADSDPTAELEGYRRGPYAGAVLYALPGGVLDACIAIRTIVLHDGVALLQAGAGIVADSDPTAEHEECLRKLAALETAIDLAEAGKIN